MLLRPCGHADAMVAILVPAGVGGGAVAVSIGGNGGLTSNASVTLAGCSMSSNAGEMMCP